MFTGQRYHETQGLSLPVIAQRMRADIAHLRTLQQLPEHAVISVRTDQKGTGSGSITITVSGLRDTEVWRTPGVTDTLTRDSHWGGLTPLGRGITDALEEIHHAYNYDRSDTMTDYFDRRYYGQVTIRNEETQRWEAQQKAQQQARAAANRADRHAADALPLRATIVGDRPARLVITDSRTGQGVAEISTKNYTRELLTTSYVTYLLNAYGWTVARYHRRSKTTPAAYWTVARADDADPIDVPPATPGHHAEDDRAERDRHAEPAPVPALPADTSAGPTDVGSAEEGQDLSPARPAELDPANWIDLDFDHWAARWVRDTEVWPADDPARIWSQATATLIAAGYCHERHDAPGAVDHTARLVTTDARDDVADEAAELSRHAAAVIDQITADIREIYPQARPIVLDGTGLSGTRCETRCGALSRWWVPNPSTNDRTPSRLAYCQACLLAHAHPVMPAPMGVPDLGEAEPETVADPPTLFEIGAANDAVDEPKTLSRRDPTALAEQDQADEPEDFDGVEIMHTAETGTLLLGTTKGDGSYDALRGAGQRWRGLRHGDYAGALFLPHTRDRAADRYTMDRAAQILRAAGWTVRVRIDDTPRDPAQVAADRRERSADRADRLRGRAARRFASSDAAHGRADQIGERFAGGQPILIGHHSEKRARRDRDRMHAAMDRACELRAEGERLADVAEAAERNATRQDSGPRISRRIDRATAEEARITRALDGYTRRFRYSAGYLEEEHPAATGTHREQLLGQLAHVRAALAADRQALADLAAANMWRPIDAATIRPGDQIRTGGLWRTVVRVNKATVSVTTGYTWTDRVRFAEITHHRAAPAT